MFAHPLTLETDKPRISLSLVDYYTFEFHPIFCYLQNCMFSLFIRNEISVWVSFVFYVDEGSRKKTDILHSGREGGGLLFSPLDPDRNKMWKFLLTKKGIIKTVFLVKKTPVFWTHKQIHEKGGGLNPYDQPDLKISVFYDIPNHA